VIESLTVDGLDFVVRRSTRRKTIGLTLERDGGLLISAPTDCDAEALREAVQSRLLWIHTKLAARRLLQGTPPPHRYRDGEGYWYLGASHRLKVVRGAPEAPPLRLNGGWFELAESERGRAREHFVAWYGAELRAWVASYGGRFAARLGVQPTAVTVASLGHRWGSCEPDGEVRLHWRLALLPTTAIEYVFVHELAHLRSPRHDRTFWGLVDRALPDGHTRRRWLAAQGARYDL
jgi:predicted metal-dependent hydrolase